MRTYIIQSKGNLQHLLVRMSREARSNPGKVVIRKVMRVGKLPLHLKVQSSKLNPVKLDFELVGHFTTREIKDIYYYFENEWLTPA